MKDDPNNSSHSSSIPTAPHEPADQQNLHYSLQIFYSFIVLWSNYRSLGHPDILKINKSLPQIDSTHYWTATRNQRSKKEVSRWNKKIQQIPEHGFCFWLWRPQKAHSEEQWFPAGKPQVLQARVGITSPEVFKKWVNVALEDTAGWWLCWSGLMVGFGDLRFFPTFIILWISGDSRLFFHLKKTYRECSSPLSSEERFTTL